MTVDSALGEVGMGGKGNLSRNDRRRRKEEEALMPGAERI